MNTEMTKPIRTWVLWLGFSLVPGLLFVLLHDTINRVAYPPPIYTLLVMLTLSEIPGHLLEILVGALLQVVAFLILNSYLLHPRWRTLAAFRVWVPSLLLLLFAFILEAVPAKEAWERVDYPGAREVAVAGIVALVAAVMFAIAMVRSRWSATHSVLAFNCYLHCAAIAVLFPHVGELP